MYSAILVGLLICTIPTSWAGKPQHACEDGSEPDFINLGGYNVPEGDFDKGIDMVNELWRKEEVQVYPSTVFGSNDPDGSISGDGKFAFKKKDGQWLGIGVDSGILDLDKQIDHKEGLYIKLGAERSVKELFFGTRSHYDDKDNDLGTEAGKLFIYKDGVKVGNQTGWIFEADGDGGDTGQEYFHFESEVEFDAFAFKPYHWLPLLGDDGHNFYLEYVDICDPPAPTAAPTDAGIKGDPHIETWSGMKYDFHGVCDLVLLQNQDFRGRLGMDIHVRTKQIKQFSYVSSAVLRIGNETLEVMGDIHKNLYWINRQPNANLENGINEYPISYKKVNSKQHEFTVRLGGNEAIVIKTFKKFVRVNFVGATKQSFGTSRGLLGSYGAGKLIARDNVTVLENTDVFGQEWQVLPSEGVLFHNVEGPQAPAKCEIPMATNLRRRLAESANINEEDAKMACGRVNPADFDMCVFDVMATGDMDVVGAY